MKIKTLEETIANYSSTSRKISENSGFSFSEILNQVSSKPTTENTDKKETLKTGNILIDNLPEKNKGEVLKAISDLNDIFDIDILGDPEQFINKKDHTINMPRILSRFGNNVSSDELNDLGEAVNTLMENGLISEEDYFATLKWIATRKEATRLKIQSEENIKALSDSIFKSNKNNDNDYVKKLII